MWVATHRLNTGYRWGRTGGAHGGCSTYYGGQSSYILGGAGSFHLPQGRNLSSTSSTELKAAPGSPNNPFTKYSQGSSRPCGQILWARWRSACVLLRVFLAKHHVEFPRRVSGVKSGSQAFSSRPTPCRLCNPACLPCVNE